MSTLLRLPLFAFPTPTPYPQGYDAISEVRLKQSKIDYFGRFNILPTTNTFHWHHDLNLELSKGLCK